MSDEREAYQSILSVFRFGAKPHSYGSDTNKRSMFGGVRYSEDYEDVEPRTYRQLVQGGKRVPLVKQVRPVPQETRTKYNAESIVPRKGKKGAFHGEGFGKGEKC